uniref:Uncharacterized protein n=1 Tax=Amphimedon queenslandica TaxID=400682 RepID=A0A1X7UXW0_AMPQE
MSRNPVRITFEATADQESSFHTNNTNRGHSLFLLVQCQPQLTNRRRKLAIIMMMMIRI